MLCLRVIYLHKFESCKPEAVCIYRPLGLCVYIRQSIRGWYKYNIAILYIIYMTGSAKTSLITKDRELIFLP